MFAATPHSLPTSTWAIPQIELNNERDLKEAFPPPPPIIVVFIVTMSLLFVFGAFALCLMYGYDGVAFTASLDNWTIQLGCYRN